MCLYFQKFCIVLREREREREKEGERENILFLFAYNNITVNFYIVIDTPLYTFYTN